MAAAVLLVFCAVFVQQVAASCPTLPSTIDPNDALGPAPDSACTEGICYNVDGLDMCFPASTDAPPTTTCTDADTTHCPKWAGSGFCTSVAYTETQKKSFCAKTCNLCGAVTDVCKDASSSCASWNTNGFCASTTYSTAEKIKYCQKTCGQC